MLKKLHQKIKDQVSAARHIHQEKEFLLEGSHPDHPPKIIKARHLHQSVFEPNHPPEAHPDHAFLKAVFSWISPEFHQHPKTIAWWVTAGIIVAILAIVEALSGNWTFLLAIIVFSAVYLHSHFYHPPRHTKIVISDAGFKVGHKQIPYADIKEFWIIRQPPQVNQLHLYLHRHLFPELIIHMEDQNPEEIRQFLLDYLPEAKKTEKLPDLILRKLKL